MQDPWWPWGAQAWNSTTMIATYTGKTPRACMRGAMAVAGYGAGVHGKRPTNSQHTLSRVDCMAQPMAYAHAAC